MSGDINNIVVVGTGLMAPGIAAAVAMSSSSVTIVGRNRSHADAAAQAATQGNADLSETNIRSGDLTSSVLSEADLIIETIIEDLETKLELFRKIEPWLNSTAIVTTNTSSLSLDVLLSGVNRSTRFAGLHFLYPANQTGVVEVVAHDATDAKVIRQLCLLAEQMKKTPILVKNPIPGFVWNRIQFAVLRECLYLLDLGIASASDIDAAVAQGLAPRWMAAGPLATADLGGTETFQRIAKELFPQLSADSNIRGALAEGRPFYSWSPSARAAVNDLRGRALRMAMDSHDARLHRHDNREST